MKALTASALLLLFQLGPALPSQEVRKAAVEGRILRAGASEPLAGAQLTLIENGENGVGGSNDIPGVVAQFEFGGMNRRMLSAKSDGQGRFAFRDLVPGTYRLVVSANGYVRQEYGQRVFPGTGRPLRLSEGQTIADLIVAMTPAGTITGAVRSEAGRPIANVTVKLQGLLFDRNGQKTLTPLTETRTNDLGEYRLYYVTPGRYYLTADSGGRRIPNEYTERYTPTLYPGVTDVGQATVLDIRPGSNRSGMDFVLRQQQLRQIRGRVVGSGTSDAAEVKQVTLLYLSSDPAGGLSTNGRSPISVEPVLVADGSFQFIDLTSGFYALTFPYRGQRALQTISIANDDVENLRIAIPPGPLVSGLVRVEGRPLTNANIRVALSPQLPGWEVTQMYGAPSTTVESDGKFTLNAVSALNYRLLVDGLPPDYFVKEARIGGMDILNQTFRLLSIASPVDILISSNAGEIDGAVLDERLQPLEETRVVLIPDRARNAFELYRTVNTGRDGRFRMTGVPPGDYKIFAWETIEQYSWFDPDVIRRFESSGQQVRVAESSKQTFQLKVIVEN